MQTAAEKTVREIAIENPWSIRVFESLGIDYCCGGKRPLNDACSRVNVGVGHVMDLLEAAERDSQALKTDEWTEKPMRDLIAHIIETHHGFVRREIPRLQALLTKVAAKHGPAHPNVVEIEPLFAAIAQELSTHMLKEEQVLFPYLVRMEQAVSNGTLAPQACFGSVKAPIANMTAEHDDAGAVLASIRELANGYKAPVQECAAFAALYSGLEDFERDLHRHVHLENNILFPRAIEMERGR